MGIKYKNLGYQVYKLVVKKEVFVLRKSIQSVFRKYVDNYKINFDKLLINLFNNDFDGFIGCANICQNLPDLYSLCFHKKIISFLNKIGLKSVCMNTRPLISFSSRYTAKNENYWKVAAHQDWPSTLGSLNGTTCWIPLVDLPNKSLGPLEIVPKSHLLGKLEDIDNGIPILKQNINLDFKPIFMNCGDILLFNNFTVHKSGDNTTDQIRLSVHFRYDDFSEKTFMKRKYPRFRKDIRISNNMNDFSPSKTQIKKALDL